MSMQIEELEEALGGVLLERSARQVALTNVGEEAAQRVRDILRLVDELGDLARASRDSDLRTTFERYTGTMQVILRGPQWFTP
jgi:DNA-binding transcriptional LysR family regulator